MAYSILNSNRSYQIDWTGKDRITQTTNNVLTNQGSDVRRTSTYFWAGIGNTPTLVSQSEQSTTGLQSWQMISNNGVCVTNSSRTVYAAGGYRYVTNTAPDGSYAVSTYQNGLLLSVVRKSGSTQLSSVTYGYDSHGRQNQMTDARAGTTSNYFNNADQISGVVTPQPASGQQAQVPQEISQKGHSHHSRSEIALTSTTPVPLFPLNLPEARLSSP